MISDAEYLNNVITSYYLKGKIMREVEQTGCLRQLQRDIVDILDFSESLLIAYCVFLYPGMTQNC